MNKNNAIKKCLDELHKDDFRKDYVIGILETLFEMDNSVPVVKNVPVGEYIPTPSAEPVGFVTPSGIKPIVPTQVSPELIAKLRGQATVEEINILNAPKKE